MSNEQEDMPKTQLSQEDIILREKQIRKDRMAAHRESHREALSKPAKRTKRVNTEKVAADPAPKQTLAVMALFLSILMGAFAAFLFMQLQEANKQLKTAEAVLTGHAKNLAKLNNQLSATDENSNLSTDALKILLNDNTNEIRKIWDLSSNTNKPRIASNNQEISNLKASVSQFDKRTASIDRKVSNVDSKLATANNVIDNNNRSIESSKRSIDANKKGIKGNTSSIDELKASIALYQNTIDDKFAAPQTSTGVTGEVPVGAEARIQNNEQAIRSIDATRKKLNGSMADVEFEFNEMKLEIEDIQIRLDRMQNAMTGTL